MLTAENIKQKIETEDLIKLVPHKGKMFLLSRVINHDSVNHTITTEYDITENCIFYDKEKDGIPSYAGFEIMAQGISVLSSIERIVNKITEPPRPGVVLSLTGFEASVDVLKKGTTIVMKIAEDFRGDGIFKYNCNLFESRESINPSVKASITVMEIQDMKNFFEGV